MMNIEWPFFVSAFVFAIRLAAVRRLWDFPRERMNPDLSMAFLRRYRATLLALVFLDMPLAVWLATTSRLPALVGEQFLALVLTAIANNLAVTHFASRAAMLAHPTGERPEPGLQISMSPRRLRDHTNWLVELAIAALMLLSLALVQRAHAIRFEPAAAWNPAKWLRSVDSVTAWVLYLQVGLLLLKVVFVRWRMPLPTRRTDDFRRWRTAWLNYHLRLFDGLRILFALALFSAILGLTRASESTAAFTAGWVLVLLVFAVWCRRQKSYLTSVAREIKPLELVREFPRTTAAEGRFLLGFFYIAPGNPGVLVHSGNGIALNITHPATYLWAAYLCGLAALIGWVTQ